MQELHNLLRENIKNIVPYSSARSEFEATSEILLDANELPFGDWNRYPDPLQKKLRAVIEIQKNIRLENIFLGNGSDEIIDLLIRVFCNPGKDSIAIFTPTYGMYKVCAALNDVQVNNYPLTPEFQINEGDVETILKNKSCKIIFLCTPNNPTGNEVEIPERLLREFKGILVIDEAYKDFSSKKSMLQELDSYPRVLILQTLSKAFGLAGVRIGMGFASPEMVSILQRVKPPYNISGPNQEAALSALQNEEGIKEKVSIILREKEILRSELENLDFVKKVYTSEANFFLVEVTDAKSIYDYLVSKRIIVRNRHTEIKNCLRITIGTPEENVLLITTLKKYNEYQNSI